MLDVRVRALEQVQQRFAYQQKKVVELTTIANDIETQLKQHLLEPSEPDPLLSQQRFYYIQHLRKQMGQVQEAIRQEDQILDVVREELRQALVQKKSLEKLKDKQSNAYYKSIDAQLEKETEDLVVAQYHRG